MRKLFFAASAAAFLLLVSTASAHEGHSQQIALTPGWNVVSTPRLLESHSFSAPETLANFSIYTLDPTSRSGWATMAELGQTEFTPLYGYFIENKTSMRQILTLNYEASTTPNERLFERTFDLPGWYSFGIANPSYAKAQGGEVVDTDNPNHILNSLLGATSNYDAVIDFTDESFAENPDLVALTSRWRLAVRSVDAANTSEINSLNDFRETKGYAIYIKASSTLSGFQNNDTPPHPVDPIVWFHYHTILNIFINGVRQVVPAGIGITTVVDAPMHTHENDNVIHVESNSGVSEDDLRLGTFFAQWGKEWTETSFMGHPLDADHTLTMTLTDGVPSTEFAHLPMKANQEVTLNYQ